MNRKKRAAVTKAAVSMAAGAATGAAVLVVATGAGVAEETVAAVLVLVAAVLVLVGFVWAAGQNNERRDRATADALRTDPTAPLRDPAQVMVEFIMDGENTHETRIAAMTALAAYNDSAIPGRLAVAGVAVVAAIVAGLVALFVK